MRSTMALSHASGATTNHRTAGCVSCEHDMSNPVAGVVHLRCSSAEVRREGLQMGDEDEDEDEKGDSPLGSV